MISSQIKRRLELCLKAKVHPKIIVKKCIPISGGCINNAIKLETNKETFFAKYNKNAKSDMFQTEHDGLKVLKDTNAICIPDMIAFENNFLILEFIPLSNPDACFWENFGRSLAKMHQKTDEKFGLDFDNYIGTLPQSNTQDKNWVDFFIQNRLLAQLDMGNYSPSVRGDFEKLFEKLPNIFPANPPSLLHGDLWSGNFLIKDKETPVLIDPAIYFGNREMDIAMCKLFSGFHTDFYDSYNEKFPLENDWEERIRLCNLYPLLVHVNLFGRGYLNQVKNILSYYVG